MKKISLLIVLVLSIGACSTVTEPVENSSDIGQQLNLTTQNGTEKWLTGRWTSEYNETRIEDYNYDSIAGKRISLYDVNADGQRILSSDHSYEIREDYFGENQHLLVTYIHEGLDENHWDKQLIYSEIVELGAGYTEYLRIYKSIADIKKGPEHTVRGMETGTWEKI